MKEKDIALLEKRNPFVKSLKLSKTIGEPYVAFLIDGLFSDSECAELIEKASSRWSKEHTNKYGEKWSDDALRNNLSAHMRSVKVAGNIYERVQPLLKGSIGLNENLRWNLFNRADQAIAPHVDGEYVSGKGTISKLTFLLYLNSCRKGGETRFLSAKTMRHVDVTPVAGRVLLFDQRLPHAALPVGKGLEKITLRSDVMYAEGG